MGDGERGRGKAGGGRDERIGDASAVFFLDGRALAGPFSRPSGPPQSGGTLTLDVGKDVQSWRAGARNQGAGFRTPGTDFLHNVFLASDTDTGSGQVILSCPLVSVMTWRCGNVLSDARAISR